QQAHELSAEICQPVFDTRRNLWKLNPLENSSSSEMAQAIHQHLGADALDVSFQRPRPHDSLGHGRQDTYGPPTANDFFQQHRYPLRVQFRHCCQNVFVALCHKFTPICWYPTKLCPLSQPRKSSNYKQMAANFLKFAVTESVREAQEQYFGVSQI